MTINSDIDKLFKQGLADHSEKAPDFIWEGIEASLKNKRQKKRRNALYAVAASVALLLSFGAGYLLTSTPEIQIAQNGEVLSDDGQTEAMTMEKPTQTNVSVKDETPQKPENLNTKNNTPNSNDEPIKSQQIQKSTIDKKEPSKIKAKKSEGTLLPPMFASNNDVQEMADENSQELTNTLQPLNKKEVDIAQKTVKPELKYEIRQLPVYETTIANTKPDTKKEKNWSVGINASPLYSYRDVYNVPEQDVLAANNISSYDMNYTNEKPLVSYAAGVDVNYNLSSRWEIKSGVYYAEIGQVSENINLNKVASYNDTKGTSYAVNTSSGNLIVNGTPNELIQRISPESSTGLLDNGPLLPGFDRSSVEPLQTNFVQTYEYYEIPLLVNYKVIDKKLGVKIGGGVSANILAGNTNYVENEDTRYNIDANMQGMNQATYSGIVGLGMEYPIIKALDFNFQPTFRYNLNPITSSGNVHPYSFGIFTGLKYSF